MTQYTQKEISGFGKVDAGPPTEKLAYELLSKAYIEDKLSPEDRQRFIERYGDPLERVTYADE